MKNVFVNNSEIVNSDNYKIGYLVSYIDGEGCLDLNVNKRYSKKLDAEKIYIYSRTIISNKNLESLQSLQDFLKLGKIRYVASQDIYRYELNDKDTETIINRYGDLFITKRLEANILKRFYRNRNAGQHLVREMRKIKRGINNELQTMSA